MRIELNDVGDVRRLAALKAGVECGLVVKEVRSKEVYPFLKRGEEGKTGFIDVEIENASEETKARFNHLYAKYVLEEKTSSRIRTVPMIVGGAGYVLGLSAALIAVAVGAKRCEIEPEPVTPKQIQKAKTPSLIEKQNQLTR